MSDNKTPESEFGEPIDEPTPNENVVDRANEALADAEAARDGVAASHPSDDGATEGSAAIPMGPASDSDDATAVNDAPPAPPAPPAYEAPEPPAYEAPAAPAYEAPAAPADAPSAADAPVATPAAVPTAPAANAAPADDEPDWSVLDDALAEDAAKEAQRLDTPAADPVVANAEPSRADTNADANRADTNINIPNSARDDAARDAAVEEAQAEADAKTTVAPVVAADEDAPGGKWYDSPEVTQSTSKLPESVQGVTEVPLTPPAALEEDEVLTGVAPAQPIFVQAPEPPLVRGNRGAAGAIGLLTTLIFAVVYLAARLLFSGINIVDSQELLDETMAQVSSFAFWVPVVVFFLAFWLLGAFVNRGRWGYWVVFGLLVGLAAYAGHVIGAVIQANPWQITADQAMSIMREEALAPAAIVALVLGRELPIWFGGWIARRGRRITVENGEAQEEYERTLEAGPKLSHA